MIPHSSSDQHLGHILRLTCCIKTSPVPQNDVHDVFMYRTTSIAEVFKVFVCPVCYLGAAELSIALTAAVYVLMAVSFC